VPSFLLLCLVALLPLEVAGEAYHVDSADGDDNVAGTSVDTGWHSLKKVNATTFSPGDQILFKAGGAWRGQLHPKRTTPADRTSAKSLLFLAQQHLSPNVYVT
jgi:hypothetical protein